MVKYPSKWLTISKTDSNNSCYDACREEFIKSYVDTRQRLIERQEEVMREMVDHARQQEEVKFRLEEAYEKEA